MEGLTRDQIRDASARKGTFVPVPEWGGSVMIVTISTEMRLSLHERLRLLVKDCPRDEQGRITDASSVNSREARDIDLTLLASALADKSGESVYSVEELHDMAYTQEDVLIRLVGAAYEFNGFRAGAVDDAAKKSGASPSAT